MTPPVSQPATDTTTFAALWETTSANHTDRTFLVFQDQDGATAQWTYGEFAGIVNRMSERLLVVGVRHGDGIHVCMRNSPSFVALWLAAARIGAWINPVDPSSSAREITQQLQRTHSSLGVVGTEQAETYRAGSVNFEGPVWEIEESIAGLHDFANPGDDAGEGVEEGEARRQFAAVTPLDRLAVMFTSGTTSQPKGVVLTQSNYRQVAKDMAAAADLNAEHRWYVTLPMFHANAQYYCFAAALEVGASVALTASFSASRWVEGAITTQATHASLFAAPIRMVLARTPAEQRPAQLKHVWYAQNLGSDHHAQFGELVGVAPRQLYGMTETVSVVTYDRTALPAHDLIGLPIPGRRALLIDHLSHRPVAAGEVGMIAVEGRRGHDLFLEYLDDEQMTARSLIHREDGRDLLLTGDLAVDTGDGGWKFVGRNDDVIKVSGENVSLTEIEAALAQAPGVLEAAVLAEADPIRDVVPVAYVVSRDPSTPLDTDLLADWANRNLSKAAVPRRWHQIAALPRTSVGKVRRFKLDAATTSI